MFFKNYKQHNQKKYPRESLFWEYDMKKFDWNDMKNIVIQRTIERGRIEDFYAILNLYGINSVKETIRQIPYLNSKDLSFVCTVFDLNKEELKCFIKKQSTNQHWNS